MIKATVTGDETACTVLDANAIVEGGKITGARVTLKFVRPLAARSEELLMLQVEERIPVHTPHHAPEPVKAPATPTVSQSKP